jgi:hypothetical protein
MLRIIFTLDYEIHGNGEGCPRTLMVEPTDRMLRLFDQYGAKLTIMADVAEIMRFKEYRDKYNRDDYYYDAIVDQLRRAVRTGHDVQLHIHSSYFNARYQDGRWLQDWSEYDFANLPIERMQWMVGICKEFLERQLRLADPNYRCIAFRAANWSTNPSRNVAQALLANNIKIDTSVFKGGRRQGIVNFDYTSAHHRLLPWPANPDDICRFDAGSELWEFPIYSEDRRLGAFITPNRFYRALLGRLHRVSNNPSVPKGALSDRKRKTNTLSWISQRHAWKADFNQCSGRQLSQALLRGRNQVSDASDAPFILIGHAKLFNRWNEHSIRSFLSFVQNHSSWFSFDTLGHVAGIWGLRNDDFHKSGRVLIELPER